MIPLDYIKDGIQF